MEQKYVDIASMKGIIGDIENALFGAGLPFVPRNFDFQQPHILFHQSLVILVFAAINLLFLRSQKDVWRSSIFWLLFLAGLFLMMSYISLPIWEASSILQKVQAPWRLFSIFSFGGAALCASTTVGICRLKFRSKFLLSLIIIIVFMFNISYSYKLARKFPALKNPGRANLDHLGYVKIAIEDPYSERLFDVGEYRPLVNQAQPSPPPIVGQAKISLISGQADIIVKEWKSYQRNFDITVIQEATVKIRTYYYPAWHLYVNNKPYNIRQYQDGTIAFDLKPGKYIVNLRYQKTQAFTLGILISLFSLTLLIISCFFI